jgi:hypothetical protein
VETICSVLEVAKNEEIRHLTKVGKILVFILDRLR